ncbi:uncharacterized protein LOC128558479 isoform X2 [Mercenaria mercenaria]|uniref:uncharacterized protein LOC128558479 isoform X2 n=1 Tax=Mercenaria mercenaria TaxID=6596 RepID=UPI00234F4DB5|nr:uncharacterized protein LOC128558479 isoform X2 [Mercenaria mercenaria]
MKATVFDEKVSIIVKRAETLKQKREVNEYIHFMNAESSLVKVLHKSLEPRRKFCSNTPQSKCLLSSKNLENKCIQSTDICAKACVEDAKPASGNCFDEPEAAEVKVDVDDWAFVQTKLEMEDTTTNKNYTEVRNNDESGTFPLTNTEYSPSTEVKIDVEDWAFVKTKLEVEDTAVSENCTTTRNHETKSETEDTTHDGNNTVMRNHDGKEENCRFTNSECKPEFIRVQETKQNIYKDQNGDMTNYSEKVRPSSAENVKIEENSRDLALPKHNSDSLVSVFCNGKLVEIINGDNSSSHLDKGVVRNDVLYANQFEVDVPQMVKQEPI